MPRAESRRRRQLRVATPASGDGRTTIDRAVAVAATIVAIAFHVSFFTHAGALWRDEVNSVHTATAATWSGVWRNLEFESFPIFWVALLRGWIAIAGDSDVALRLFGGIGGLALVAAVWLAMRWCRPGGALPLVGLALLAVNPEVIRWSASVRAWGPGAALAVLTVVLTYKATVLPTRSAVIAAVVAAVVGAQCMYQNAIVAMAAGVAAAAPCISRREWRRAAIPLGIGAAAVASLVPYIGVLARRAEWTGLSARPTPVGDLLARLWDLMRSSGGITAWAWIGLIALAFAIALRSKAAAGVRQYAGIALLLAGAGLIIFYLYLGYPTQNWYYLPLAALAAVGTDVVLAADARARILRQVRLAAAALILIAGGVSGRPALAAPFTNMNHIAAELAARARPGDLIVLSPWYLGVAFSRAYSGPVDVTSIPPMSDPGVHRYDLLKVAMTDGRAMDPVLARIKQVLQSGHCVWIVGVISAPMPRPPDRLPPPPLPDTGWSSGPYEKAWILHAGELLADHALSGDAVPVPRGGALESPNLVVIRGWR